MSIQNFQFPQPIEEASVTLTRTEIRLVLDLLQGASEIYSEDALDDLSVKLNRAVFRKVFPK